MKTTAIFAAAAAVFVAADESDRCTTAIASKVSPLLIGEAAAPCAKVIGGKDLTLVFASVTSSSDITKLLASSECTTWYGKVSTAIKSVDPPCTYSVGGAPVYKTSEFNFTFEEFLKKNAESKPTPSLDETNAPTTTTVKPSTKPATPAPGSTTNTNSTKPATTTVTNSTTGKPDAVITPPSSTPPPTTTSKSASATSAVALTALAVAAYMSN